MFKCDAINFSQCASIKLTKKMLESQFHGELSFLPVKGKFPTNFIFKDVDCQTGKGESYKGTVSRSRRGYTCQNWTANSPHLHNWTSVGNHNHCRNPGEDAHNIGGVWCYTTSKFTRWQECNVPKCEDMFTIKTYFNNNKLGTIKVEFEEEGTSNQVTEELKYDLNIRNTVGHI